jgi:hypothetical protein
MAQAHERTVQLLDGGLVHGAEQRDVPLVPALFVGVEQGGGVLGCVRLVQVQRLGQGPGVVAVVCLTELEGGHRVQCRSKKKKNNARIRTIIDGEHSANELFFYNKYCQQTCMRYNIFTHHYHQIQCRDPHATKEGLK